MRPVDGVCLFLALVAVLGVASSARVECFKAREANEDDALRRNKTTSMVWTTFEDVLKRPPSRYELDIYVRKAEDKGLTKFALENILLNSEEYRRDTKVASDSPAAEMRRVNSEQYVIAHIVAIFEDVRGERPVPQIILPLKDVYEVLGPQDDELFRAFLESPRYADWQNDALMRLQDNYKTETTIDVYRLWYGELPPVTGAPPPRHAPPGFHGDGEGDEDAPFMPRGRDRRRHEILFDRPDTWDGRGRGQCGQAPRACDPDEECRAKAGAGRGDDGDGHGAVVDAIAASEKPLRLYFDPERDSVVDPSLRWKLPDHKPPVCRTLRGARDGGDGSHDKEPAAYMVVSGDLAGTALKDVYHNDVPQYELREYIEIPRDEVRFLNTEGEAHVPR